MNSIPFGIPSKFGPLKKYVLTYLGSARMNFIILSMFQDSSARFFTTHPFFTKHVNISTNECYTEFLEILWTFAIIIVTYAKSYEEQFAKCVQCDRYTKFRDMELLFANADDMSAAAA